jgi:hypothetical protein
MLHTCKDEPDAVHRGAHDSSQLGVGAHSHSHLTCTPQPHTHKLLVTLPMGVLQYYC